MSEVQEKNEVADAMVDGRQARRLPDFITPEMVADNPLLDMAGVFAGNEIYAEVVKEIAKERARQRRRDSRRATK